MSKQNPYGLPQAANRLKVKTEIKLTFNAHSDTFRKLADM